MPAMPKNAAISHSAARNKLRVMTTISAAPRVQRARRMKKICSIPKDPFVQASCRRGDAARRRIAFGRLSH